jgi:hypothetical protein
VAAGYDADMADSKTPTTPRKRTRAKKITEEQIAARAYELSQNDGTASPEENWHRAEQELRGTASDSAS